MLLSQCKQGGCYTRLALPSGSSRAVVPSRLNILPSHPNGSTPQARLRPSPRPPPLPLAKLPALRGGPSLNGSRGCAATRGPARRAAPERCRGCSAASLPAGKYSERLVSGGSECVWQRHRSRAALKRHTALGGGESVSNVATLEITHGRPTPTTVGAFATPPPAGNCTRSAPLPPEETLANQGSAPVENRRCNDAQVESHLLRRTAPVERSPPQESQRVIDSVISGRDSPEYMSARGIGAFGNVASCREPHLWKPELSVVESVVGNVTSRRGIHPRSAQHR